MPFLSRAEYGEKTVQKLNLRIDNIMYDLVQEKTKTQTVNDELDQTFNLFVTHWRKETIKLLEFLRYLSLILSIKRLHDNDYNKLFHYLAPVLHSDFMASRVDKVFKHTITKWYTIILFWKGCIDGRVAMFQIGNTMPICWTTWTWDCIDSRTDCKSYHTI